MNTFEENWEVTTHLAPECSDRIQAVLRCLRDNSDLEISLLDPEVGGRSVGYELGAGDASFLDDCCALRGVEKADGKLVVPE